jgi:hypothetical protein
MMQSWGCRTAFSPRLWAIRALDKFIEQLAKGKAMEKNLRPALGRGSACGRNPTLEANGDFSGSLRFS